MSHARATNFLNVRHKALAAASVVPSLLIKAYLVTYNVLSVAGWSLVLYRTLSHLFVIQTLQRTPTSFLAGLKASPNPFFWIPSFVPASLVPLYQRACTTYDAVGGTTARVQTVAVLEVLHVLLGLVRSPLSTTAVQVASRLFSVWGIAAYFPSVRSRTFRFLLEPTY
jgi:very-long-chain (3R)-3-hydroxyacyl-CoA dehydratase